MDKETLLNIIEGDREAYSKLYVDYFKKLYNYGKKFTEDGFILQDSIQEVFLDIWIKKDKLKGIDTAGSYFFSSFRYTLLRKIKQSRKTVQSNEFETEPVFSSDHFMISKEVSEELQRKLQTALNDLTPHQREAIFLRFYEGLSYEEVAAILHISVKATYKIMARSLSALKDNMLISVPALLFLLRLKV
jgi:RNA polymerase sigma factor (sigma-70 family)